MLNGYAYSGFNPYSEMLNGYNVKQSNGIYQREAEEWKNDIQENILLIR